MSSFLGAEGEKAMRDALGSFRKQQFSVLDDIQRRQNSLYAEAAASTTAGDASFGASGAPHAAAPAAPLYPLPASRVASPAPSAASAYLYEAERQQLETASRSVRDLLAMKDEQTRSLAARIEHLQRDNEIQRHKLTHHHVPVVAAAPVAGVPYTYTTTTMPVRTVPFVPGYAYPARRVVVVNGAEPVLGATKTTTTTTTTSTSSSAEDMAGVNGAGAAAHDASAASSTTTGETATAAVAAGGEEVTAPSNTTEAVSGHAASGDEHFDKLNEELETHQRRLNALRRILGDESKDGSERSLPTFSSAPVDAAVHGGERIKIVEALDVHQAKLDELRRLLSERSDMRAATAARMRGLHDDLEDVEIRLSRRPVYTYYEDPVVVRRTTTTTTDPVHVTRISRSFEADFAGINSKLNELRNLLSSGSSSSSSSSRRLSNPGGPLNTSTTTTRHDDGNGTTTTRVHTTSHPGSPITYSRTYTVTDTVVPVSSHATSAASPSAEKRTFGTSSLSFAGAEPSPMGGAAVSTTSPGGTTTASSAPLSATHARPPLSHLARSAMAASASGSAAASPTLPASGIPVAHTSTSPLRPVTINVGRTSTSTSAGNPAVTTTTTAAENPFSGGEAGSAFRGVNVDEAAATATTTTTAAAAAAPISNTPGAYNNYYAVRSVRTETVSPSGAGAGATTTTTTTTTSSSSNGNGRADAFSPVLLHSTPLHDTLDEGVHPMSPRVFSDHHLGPDSAHTSTAAAAPAAAHTTTTTTTGASLANSATSPHWVSARLFGAGSPPNGGSPMASAATTTTTTHTSSSSSSYPRGGQANLHTLAAAGSQPASLPEEPVHPASAALVRRELVRLSRDLQELKGRNANGAGTHLVAAAKV